jgi:LacI family transcriptional regulator
MPSERRFQPVTLADVARHARVSQSTASRVLNGSARTVGGELAERVMAAAAELQYSANLQAQAVARGTTTNLALLVSDIAGEYFSSMTAAVMASAEAAGLRVTIAITERRIEREIELVRELRGQNARAIVLAESGTRSGEGVERLQVELSAYEEAGGKVVVVSRTPMPFDFVDLDNFGGAHRLAAALTRLGYERFHVLGGDETLVTSHDRIEGFRAGLAEHGLSLPDSSITFSEFGWDGAFRAVSALDDAVLGDAQARSPRCATAGCACPTTSRSPASTTSAPCATSFPGSRPFGCRPPRSAPPSSTSSSGAARARRPCRPPSCFESPRPASTERGAEPLCGQDWTMSLRTRYSSTASGPPSEP